MHHLLKHNVSNISKKISRSIGIMYKLRPFLPINVLNYSLVYSHIVYAIEVWGSTFKPEMDKILILQKKAMRQMTFMGSYPSSIPGPLQPSGRIFSQLKTLNVMDMYHLQVAKFVFKSMNLITSLNYHDWFKLNHELHAHKTRANFNIADNTTTTKLFIPTVRTTNYGLKQLKANGPRIWNSLPTKIKKCNFSPNLY